MRASHLLVDRFARAKRLVGVLKFNREYNKVELYSWLFDMRKFPSLLIGSVLISILTFPAIAGAFEDGNRIFHRNFIRHVLNKVSTHACNFGGLYLEPLTDWDVLDWDLEFSGYGCVEAGKIGPHTWVVVEPAVADGNTHSALVTGDIRASGNSELNFEVVLKTHEQLRIGDEPNPWEVAWVVWHYEDNDNFYYVIPKPNGFELGKRDPNYPGGQRFLATSGATLFPINEWYRVQIRQTTDNTISAWVNGELIVEFKDEENPLTFGKRAVYAEDSRATYFIPGFDR